MDGAVFISTLKGDKTAQKVVFIINGAFFFEIVLLPNQSWSAFKSFELV